MPGFSGFGFGGGGSSLATPVSVANGGTGRTDGTLYDAAGTPKKSADWFTRRGYSASGLVVALDWDASQLRSSNNSISMDWEERLINDKSSVLSVAANDRRLWDAAGAQSTNWSTRLLFDSNGSTKPSVNWSLRTLIGTDGATVTANWGTKALTGGWTLNGNAISTGDVPALEAVMVSTMKYQIMSGLLGRTVSYLEDDLTTVTTGTVTETFNDMGTLKMVINGTATILVSRLAKVYM